MYCTSSEGFTCLKYGGYVGSKVQKFTQLSPNEMIMTVCVPNLQFAGSVVYVRVAPASSSPTSKQAHEP